MLKIDLILNNIRSIHNVGSIMRSADCFGVRHIYFCGYTPYPTTKNDPRLPHVYNKIQNSIHKTALGAELSVPFSTCKNINDAIKAAKAQDDLIVSLEQSKKSIPINNYFLNQNIALILGNEVSGVSKTTLQQSDIILEIPMFGQKESLNVSISTAIALYSLRFLQK